jgi:predicted DNA-binding transcriptional regulator AlpA
VAKSTPATAEDELLDAREAARIIGVSASKLYHTDFPFVVKVGGSRRYSRNGIQKYIERRQGKA